MLLKTGRSELCRMFTMFGDFKSDANDVFESLVEVCRHDPLFPEDRKGNPSHDDGWGYVAMDENSIDFRRYRKPIFNSRKPEFPESGILVVHARKAAAGEPVGMLDSHPHHRSNTEYDVYLVHNGSYRKENIAGALNEGNLDNQPDSEFFLEYLMRQEGDIEEKIRKTLEDSGRFDFVKTTNNIFVLAVDKVTRKGRLFYYGDSRFDNEYVTMYRVEKEGWVGVVSSSLLKASRFPHDVKIEKVEQRELVEIT